VKDLLMAYSARHSGPVCLMR